ncbi:MAG TPA: J domain-containing protein [Polyangiales bacterium]
MDALCAAIPIARALLKAADVAAPRTLIVAAGSRRASVSIAREQLWDLQGVDDLPLGDALLSCGALDAQRHLAALERELPVGRVGRWLIASGVASESAVRAALSQQLSRRVELLLRWRGAELMLSTTVGPAPRDASSEGHEPGWLQVSAPLAPSVYRGMVQIARELPLTTLRARAGVGALHWTSWGERLATRLGQADPLAWPTLSKPDAVGEHAPQRAALRAIGALVERKADLDGYSLLLRKRRELARRASARRLLDLPEEAHPDQARLAFRKLAQKLHPDRFHAAQPGLTDLSNRVMCALVSAEAELSAQITRKRAQR